MALIPNIADIQEDTEIQRGCKMIIMGVRYIYIYIYLIFVATPNLSF